MEKGLENGPRREVEVRGAGTWGWRVGWWGGSGVRSGLLDLQSRYDEPALVGVRRSLPRRPKVFAVKAMVTVVRL